MIRNTGAAFGGRPIGSVFLIINLYGYALYIPDIFHIYFLNMFYIFSLVCFLIYGVKSESGHDRSQSFNKISHILTPKLTFWGKSDLVLHGFVWRSSKNNPSIASYFEQISGHTGDGIIKSPQALYYPYGPKRYDFV